MRIIRKASRKPAMNRTFAKRNFAKVKVSQSMLDAVEEAMEDALSYNHLHEPFGDTRGEVDVEQSEDYHGWGMLRLNTFNYIDDSDALGVGLKLSNVGEENTVTEAETAELNKHLARLYSAENMADWLDWDVIAEEWEDISGEEFKEAWINQSLDSLIGEDEANNAYEQIDEILRGSEPALLADLYVDFKADSRYATEPSVCEVSLGLSDGRGTFESVYNTEIRLTGNEARDTKAIVKAIEHAGQCL